MRKGFHRTIVSFQGQRLKQARERAKLTQRDLATRCDLTDRQISRYEKGSGAPNAESLSKLAHELQVSSDWLLNLTDQPTATIPEISPRLRRILDSLAEFDEPEIEAILRAFHTLKHSRTRDKRL